MFEVDEVFVARSACKNPFPSDPILPENPDDSGFKTDLPPNIIIAHDVEGYDLAHRRVYFD